MTSMCMKCGYARVTHASAAVKNHKWFVEEMGALTQMRFNHFANQVARNYFSMS